MLDYSLQHKKAMIIYMRLVTSDCKYVNPISSKPEGSVTSYSIPPGPTPRGCDGGLSSPSEEASTGLGFLGFRV